MGIKEDLRRLLSESDPAVPIQVNIHPYHRVHSLPFDDANWDVLMDVLPELQEIVRMHNMVRSDQPTYLFLGVEGLGHSNPEQIRQIQKWKNVIDEFNRSGDVRLDLLSSHSRGQI